MAEIVVNLDRVSVNLSGRTLFAELSWELQQNQRIGLVGPNGSGKSTLLKLIAQELVNDSGNIYRRPGLTWGRLEQEPELPAGRSVLEEASTAIPELGMVEKRLAWLEQEMGRKAVYQDPAALEKTMLAHEAQLEAFERLGGPAYQSRIQEMLHRLGLPPLHWQTQTDLLSGGQKKLVMLAKILLNQPQMLLLDEPDNHFDLQAKQQLEKIITEYDGLVVIVSHDRYLLDEVATHIAELENGRLTVYPGNYTNYANERAIRRLRQQQRYAAQQKEIARIEAAIKRFELWASLVVNERHIKQARSRYRMLEKMDKIEKVAESRRMSLDLAGWRGSNKVLELVDIVKTFADGRKLYRALNLELWHGERVGLVGPNGVGKSYLLKQLLNPQAIDSGEIKIGPSTKVGYYAQEQETLDLAQTPIDLIRQTAPVSRETAVAFLTKFVFGYDQMQQSIAQLSGGERSRLQLARLVMQRPNLLLLDEPTNNLDIVSIEVLEQALEEFVGTVLIVSHDRYFLDKTVDRIVELREGKLTEFIGGYTDYLAEMRPE